MSNHLAWGIVLIILGVWVIGSLLIVIFVPSDDEIKLRREKKKLKQDKKNIPEDWM